MQKTRCDWVTSDPIYIEYHDHEWGVPSHGEQYLFEMICLEGQQAGLSWITILKKREGYREAFCQFDPKQIAQFTDEDVEKLLLNSRIIRNKAKINSIIKNAKAFLKMKEQGEDFSAFLWSFVPKLPNERFEDYRSFPAQTPESERMSKELKKKGFSFVGPTTCYAFMQAAGIVDDHTAGCFCTENNK